MRPHATRTARQLAADARRRIRLRTPWIPGYPLPDGRWQPLPTEPGPRIDPLKLDGTHLRRASGVQRNVPRDLADKVVPRAWTDALAWLVEQLKGPLPADAWGRYRPATRALLRSVPDRVRTLADAASWWRLFEPDQAPGDLRALATHADAFGAVLERAGPYEALAVLRAHRAIPLDPVLGWLADPGAWQVPAGTPPKSANVEVAQAVWGRMGTAARWFLDQALAADRAGLQVLAAVTPGRATRAAWVADRLEVGGLIDDAVVHRIGKDRVRPVATLALPNVVQGRALGPIAPAAAALARIPDDLRLGRMRLVALALDWYCGESVPGLAAAPFPWDAVLDHLEAGHVKYALFYCVDPRALAEMIAGGLPFDDLTQAQDAIRVAKDRGAARVAAVASALLGGGDRSVAARASFALSVVGPDDLDGLRVLIDALPADWAVEESATLAAAGAPALVAWLASGAAPRLRRLHALGELAGTALAPPPPLPVATPWWDPLPAVLHPGCAALAAADPDPEATAHRVLGPVFPDPEALRREIAWLEGRIAGGEAAPGLVPRLENLRKRLTAPTLAGPGRLAHLAADLVAAARARALDRWELHAEAAAREPLRQRLGLPLDADLRPFLDPARTASLAAISGMPRAHRGLARKLLAVRAGPPPWDLRDHPANQRVRAQLERQGIDLGPFLDPGPPRDHLLRSGRWIWLRLETDPLEVLRMGEHFGTCLSPGSANFFSAVANAVDVHRGVVFVREADGRVAGRVLVCLTESGGLLSFNLYAHRDHDELEEGVRLYLVDLARQMRTSLVQAGRVPLGAFAEWYDDGPIDRAQTQPALAPGSAFRQALTEDPPPDLLALARDALPSVLAAPLVVGWLLALPEVRERPALVASLAPLLAELPPEDPAAVDLAAALHALGLDEPVATWARLHGRRVLAGAWAEPRVEWLVDWVIDRFPGMVLRWLPEISPCADCGYRWDARSAWLAARACARLYRNAEARGLVADALRTDRHRGLPDDVRLRVYAMARELWPEGLPADLPAPPPPPAAAPG